MKISKHLLKVDFFSSYKIPFQFLQALRGFGSVNSMFWFYYWFEVPEISGLPMLTFLTSWRNALVGVYFTGSIILTHILQRRETQIDNISWVARFFASCPAEFIQYAGSDLCGILGHILV